MLILVPRETPLSIIQVTNLQKAAQAGAVVLPASPGWYHGVKSIDDLVDFIVARILDQLQVPHALMQRWGEDV
jgi:4-hydroxy-3-polyprenylbenzoate decarboxylase